MNDKNKDVLKLLKSWGICDRYVHSVSIAVRVRELPVVQVEYKLPARDDSKDEQKEYKPKFELGEYVGSNLEHLKGETLRVQQRCIPCGDPYGTHTYYVLDVCDINNNAIGQFTLFESALHSVDVPNEYKPKFKAGDVLTSIHIPNSTLYVEVVREVVPEYSHKLQKKQLLAVKNLV